MLYVNIRLSDCLAWLLLKYDIDMKKEKIMDIEIGSYIVGKDLRPKYTIWNPKTVSKEVKRHKKTARRSYKLYLKNGDIRQFNKSQRMITRRDFD
jgi:hypothetical protein